MNKIDSHEIAKRWEAGEQGCGQLIVGLQREISTLQDGQLLQLVSGNAGAQLDIPAWCRITHNPLVSANHPIYIIQKKGDQND
jgi:TusA-related sulfurtransferase